MYEIYYAATAEREQEKAGIKVPAFWNGLLDMTVIVNMFFAVTVITLAAGTVTEFQFGIADICFAADCTAVCVGCLCGGLCRFVRTGIKLDDFCFFLGVFPEQPAGIDSPAHGDHVHDIFAEEQEIVCQGNDGKQIVGEGIGDQIHQNNGKVKKSKDPCLYRDDKEQQKLCIGEECCVAEEQAEIQISYTGTAAKYHAEYIHHDDTGQIEEIEPKRAPDILHSLSQGIITEQGNGHEHQIIDPVGQRIAEQSPDLSLQNQIPVKIENVVKRVISAHLTHQIHNSGAQRDVKHKVGNAFASVLIAVKFKLPA